jgi:hypothetical protein
VTDANGEAVENATVATDFDQRGDPDTLFPDVFWRAAALQSKPARAFRLVIQVSADDLNAYRAGSLDRDDMQKRTRVQRFASPAGEVRPAPASGSGGR